MMETIITIMRVKINHYKATRVDCCAWCGKMYEKNHSARKYCSEKCAAEARRERDRAYNRYRRERRRQFPLGTSNLRGSRQKDFSREFELVEREYGRVFGDRK